LQREFVDIRSDGNARSGADNGRQEPQIAETSPGIRAEDEPIAFFL
jgi:hypothetical protein